MDHIDPNGTCLDLDIDLESGGTSDEDVSQKGKVLSFENSSNLLVGVSQVFGSSESLCGPTKVPDVVCPYYDKLITSVTKEEKKIGKDKTNVIDFKTKKEKPKMHNSAKPPKPPRPPNGPLLDASDIKLLKEISELNLKRKRMERIRTLKKKKKEKAPSLNSNLIACLVTIIFILVIIFQGVLGSKM